MSLNSKPSNGTATAKQNKGAKSGAGKPFKTETPKKGLSKANLNTAAAPSQSKSDNPY